MGVGPTMASVAKGGSGTHHQLESKDVGSFEMWSGAEGKWMHGWMYVCMVDGWMYGWVERVFVFFVNRNGETNIETRRLCFWWGRQKE